MLRAGVKGTILLAAEGINGTISGNDKGVAAVLDWLVAKPQLAGLQARYSHALQPPFYRTRVKLKREIVTMGVAELDICPGRYVVPAEWNALIQRDDVLVLDTRNHYEYSIGTFKNAINPGLDVFRDFPPYLTTITRQLKQQRRADKVAMFCTGGIRCEKATSLARQVGIDEVYHLKGGILAYLQQIPQSQSLWRGECFVFDNRVAVGHGLVQGNYDQCYACRYPITAADKQHPHYLPGESCPHCYGKRSARQRQRSAERARQMRMARKRNQEYGNLIAAAPKPA